MGYMIEISESKVDKLAEHAEKAIKHVGKLMQCIEEMQEESGSMGARGGYGAGRYGNRGGGSYGNRYGNRDEDRFEDRDDEDDGDMGERRGVKGTGRYSRYRRW